MLSVKKLLILYNFTLVRLWTLMDSNFWTRDTTCVTIKETVNSISFIYLHMILLYNITYI